MSQNDTSALERFRASMVLDFEKWHDGIGYDLAALAAATPEEKIALENLLLPRAGEDWRDVEALAQLDTPRARAALQKTLATGSATLRAAVLRYCPDLVPDAERTRALVAALDSVEIDGLSQVLDEAETFHPPPVLDALLRNAVAGPGVKAVHCAALLYYLHGHAAEPFDWAHRPFYLRFAEDPAEHAAACQHLRTQLGLDPPTAQDP